MRIGGIEVFFVFCIGLIIVGYLVRFFNFIVSGGFCGCVNDICIKRVCWDFFEIIDDKCVLFIDKLIFDNN